MVVMQHLKSDKLTRETVALPKIFALDRRHIEEPR